MTSTPEDQPTLEDQPTTQDAPAPDDAPTSEDAPALPPIDEATARELALAALREITPATTIGDPTDASVDDDGVLTLRFANRMAGYPGWFWTVSLAQVEDAAPTVLEVELTPGEGALTAPEWLPWAERLAEYQAAQAALAAEGLATDDLVIAEEEDLDDVDDVDDLDALDFDNDGSPILHSGDVDGVDIDELSDDAADEESDDDDSEDDDESDEDESDDDESDDDSDDDEDEDDESDDAESDEDDESDEHHDDSES